MNSEKDIWSKKGLETIYVENRSSKTFCRFLFRGIQFDDTIIQYNLVKMGDVSAVSSSDAIRDLDEH